MMPTVKLSAALIATSLLLSPALSLATDIPVNQNYFGATPIIRPVVEEPISTQVQPNARIEDAIDMGEEGKPPVKMPESSQPSTTGNTTEPQQNTTTPESSSMMPNPGNISYGPISTNTIPISRLLGSYGANDQRGLENLKLVFQTTFDSNRAQNGDAFVASSGNDFWANGQLLIPKGTVLRGRIMKADKSSFLDKGGELTLDFDHMVMPDGRLKSINYQMIPAISKTIPKGEQLAYSAEQGFQTIQEKTQVGINEARNKGGGLNYLLAVPTNALLGVATGTLVTTSGATKAIFGRSQAVMVQPGDEYEVGRQEVIRLLQ